MILDDISYAHYYFNLHPGFALAFEFLKRKGLSKFKPGKYEIDSDKVFALISINNAKKKEEAKLEIHKHYIDIQFSISGGELIGLKSKFFCNKPEADYNKQNDCQFFLDQAQDWCSLSKNHFAIFFPHDAHAPLVGKGIIHKVVIKIKV